MKKLTASLRHKVILEARSLTPDGAGGYEIAWEQLAILWAEITPLRGNESFQYGQIEARATHRFRLRFHEDIKAERRFSHDGHYYNIRAVLPVFGDRKILDVMVEEGGAL